MKQLIHIIYFLFFGLTTVFSQGKWIQIEADEYLKSLINFENKIPENESYSINSIVKVFDDYDATIPINMFSSLVQCKTGKTFNVRQNGSIIVQNELYNITVDTIIKQVVLQDADPALSYRKQLSDNKEFLDFASGIYKKQTNEITSYRVEFIPGYPYLAIEIDLKNDNLTKLTIYSATPFNLDAVTGSKAKVEVHFSNLEIGKYAKLQNFLTIDHFINDLKAENKLKEAYKYYEFIDLRH